MTTRLDKLHRAGLRVLPAIANATESLRDLLAVAEAVGGDQTELPIPRLEALTRHLTLLHPQVLTILRLLEDLDPPAPVRGGPDTPAPGDRPEEASGLHLSELRGLPSAVEAAALADIDRALEAGGVVLDSSPPAEDVRPGSHELDLYRLPHVLAMQARGLGPGRGAMLLQEILQDDQAKAGGEEVKAILWDPDAELAPLAEVLQEARRRRARRLPWWMRPGTIEITPSADQQRALADAVRGAANAAVGFGAPSMVTGILRGLELILRAGLPEEAEEPSPGLPELLEVLDLLTEDLHPDREGVDP